MQSLFPSVEKGQENLEGPGYAKKQKDVGYPRGGRTEEKNSQQDVSLKALEAETARILVEDILLKHVPIFISEIPSGPTDGEGGTFSFQTPPLIPPPSPPNPRKGSPVPYSFKAESGAAVTFSTPPDWLCGGDASFNKDSLLNWLSSTYATASQRDGNHHRISSQRGRRFSSSSAVSGKGDALSRKQQAPSFQLLGTRRSDEPSEQQQGQKPSFQILTKTTVDTSEPPPLMDKLSDDIMRHYAKNRLTATQFEKKLQLRDILYKLIKAHLFPRCGLYIVGSSMNGLGSSSSDMDLCLMITNEETCHRAQAVEILHRISDLLRSASESSLGIGVRHEQVILAKVPILRIQFDAPFFDIQVDLNVNNAVAIKNTHLLHYYTTCDWRLAPLAVVIKEWARSRGINDASRSTISSYSLVLMVIHFLQVGVEPCVLPNLQELYPHKFHRRADVRRIRIFDSLSTAGETPFRSENKLSVGDLLLAFFEYYAHTFDFESEVISIRIGKRVTREELALTKIPIYCDPFHWRYICIEEPFTLSNAAHSVYDGRVFETVRECFVQSLYELKRSRDLHIFLAHRPSFPLYDPKTTQSSEEEPSKPFSLEVREERGLPNGENHWTAISYQQLCGDYWKGRDSTGGRDTTVDSGISSDWSSYPTLYVLGKQQGLTPLQGPRAPLRPPNCHSVSPPPSRQSSFSSGS